MRWWNAKYPNNHGEYEITFASKDYEKAKAVEKVCCAVIEKDVKSPLDVAPVRHGRWIGCNGEIVDWDENNPGCPRHSCFCSICKSWLTASDEFPVIAYFCPNCGAKMDLEG